MFYLHCYKTIKGIDHLDIVSDKLKHIGGDGVYRLLTGNQNYYFLLTEVENK